MNTLNIGRAQNEWIIECESEQKTEHVCIVESDRHAIKNKSNVFIIGLHCYYSWISCQIWTHTTSCENTILHPTI